MPRHCTLFNSHYVKLSISLNLLLLMLTIEMNEKHIEKIGGGGGLVSTSKITPTSSFIVLDN